MKFFTFLLFTMFVFPAVAADALPTDKITCEKNGGNWGKQGLAQTEMCDMPTKDAGKACQSDDDCEAKLCVIDKSAPKEHGKCYDRTSTFGCHDLYNKDAYAKGLLSHICID